MPYIKPDVREEIDHALADLLKYPLSMGQMNYAITKILLSCKANCYDDYNALMGVLECCKQEFYRKKVAPYEDKKCDLNGDVYK